MSVSVSETQRQNQASKGIDQPKQNTSRSFFSPRSKCQVDVRKSEKSAKTSLQRESCFVPTQYRFVKSCSEEKSRVCDATEDGLTKADQTKPVRPSLSHDGCVRHEDKGRLQIDASVNVHKQDQNSVYQNLPAWSGSNSGCLKPGNPCSPGYVKETRVQSKELDSLSSSRSRETEEKKTRCARSSSVQFVRSNPCSANDLEAKTCVFDPTKYQLQCSREERRNVPLMGSQRLNSGSNQSSGLVVTPAGQTKTLMVSGTGDCVGGKKIPVVYERNTKAITNVNGFDARAQSVGEDASSSKNRNTLGIKSSFESVCRHLSLETTMPGFTLNKASPSPTSKTGEFIFWMMEPESMISSVSEGREFSNMKATEKNYGSPQHQDEPNPRMMTSRKEAMQVGRGTQSSEIEDGRVLLNSCVDGYAIFQSGKTPPSAMWKSDDRVDTSRNTPLFSSFSDNTRATPEIKRVVSVPRDTISHPELNSQNSLRFEGTSFNGLDKNHPPLRLSNSASGAKPNSENQRGQALWVSVKRTSDMSSTSGFMNRMDMKQEQIDAGTGVSRIGRGQLTSGHLEQDLGKRSCKDISLGCLTSSNYTPGRPTVTQSTGPSGVPDIRSFDNSLDTDAGVRHVTVPGLSNRPSANWEQTLLVDDPGVDELSQSIADLQDLFGSGDNILSSTLKSCYGSRGLPQQLPGSFRQGDPQVYSSSETLRDLSYEDCDLSGLTSDSNPTPLPQPEVLCDEGQFDEVCDQNNNQKALEEDGPELDSEYFGSCIDGALDCGYEWEWDSPTNSRQQFVVTKPVLQRNYSVIPVCDNQGEEQHKSSTLSHDSNPDVIPQIPTPRLISVKNRGHDFPGAKICDCIVSLASESGFFGTMVKNFVQCTMTGIEMNPRIVVRNVRQFVDGLKNYLVQQREAKLDNFIKLECGKIGSGEFLNLDTITERALHKCVMQPLHNHIHKLFVYDFTRNGNLQMMLDGIKSAKSRRIFDFEVREKAAPFRLKTLDTAMHFLKKLSDTYSPIKKLEHLISAVSAISGSEMNGMNGTNQMRWSVGSCTPLQTDVLLKRLVQAIVELDMASAEIEAEYIWGLIHPSFLTGESTYYLTIFSSAVAVVKNSARRPVQRQTTASRGSASTASSRYVFQTKRTTTSGLRLYLFDQT